jgi:signal transduction histidine kinase
VNIDRGRPLSPVLDDCVNAILAQVRLLRQIASEFSSFGSSPTPRPEVTDVPALIEGVVEPYRLGLSGRVEIEVRAPAGGASAMIDRTLFARALTNIIENALHAMPGGGRLTITIGHRQDLGAQPPATSDQPPAVVVEVTDTGVGMDEEALKRIFEPYFSTKATGTGLGLTIARRNVDLNGGRIDVRSQRDVGTTVTIDLPPAEAVAAASRSAGL